MWLRQLEAVHGKKLFQGCSNRVQRNVLVADGALLLETVLHVGLDIHGFELRGEVSQNERKLRHQLFNLSSFEQRRHRLHVRQVLERIFIDATDLIEDNATGDESQESEKPCLDVEGPQSNSAAV